MLFEDIDLFFSEGLKHVACMNDTGIAGGSSTSTLKEFGGKTSVGSEDMPFLQQVRGNVAIFDFANSRKLVSIRNDQVSLTSFLLDFYSLQVRKRTKLIFSPLSFPMVLRERMITWLTKASAFIIGFHFFQPKLRISALNFCVGFYCSVYTNLCNFSDSRKK